MYDHAILLVRIPVVIIIIIPFLTLHFYISADLPICGKVNSSICLLLQNAQQSWQNAFEDCSDQDGELLNFSIPGIYGANLTDYLLTIVPEGWNDIWTSGKTREKQWHWISGRSGIYTEK